MKKLLLSVFILPLLFACGHVLQPEQAEATTILGNPDPMSQPCVAGYTRRAPRYCLNDGPSSSPLTLDNTCRTITAPATSAVAVETIITGLLRSTNVVGLRIVNTDFYLDTGCLISHSTYEWDLREFVATVANTIILTAPAYAQLPIVSGALRYKGAITSGGAASGIIIRIVGYYD